MRFIGVVLAPPTPLFSARPLAALAIGISALAALTPDASRAEPRPAAATALPRPDAAPGPAKTHLAFAIEREGAKIGATTIDVERQNDTTTVKIATDISVKVMFMEVYRYEHSAAETWKNGLLTAFKSRTNDNGTRHAIEIAPGPTPDKLTLDVDGKRSDVPKTIAPASLWSKDVINRTDLFESDKGKRLSIKVKDVGEETLTLRGVKHQTHHYKIADKTPGEFDRDLWFEGDSLVRMKLLGSDNSTIVSDLR